MFKLPKTLLALLLATLGTIAASAQAQPVEVGFCGGGRSAGVDVNSVGTTVGTCIESDGTGTVFRKDINDPTPTLLGGIPGGTFCEVNRIVNSNAVSGNCADPQGEAKPVCWAPSAEAGTPPNELSCRLGDVACSATTINQNGVSAGTSTSGAGQTNAVVWESCAQGAPPTTLPQPGLLGLTTLGCTVSDINDKTQDQQGPEVVGVCRVNEGGTVTARAVRWRRDGLLGAYTVSELERPEMGDCFALSISDPGAAAGFCLVSGEPVAAVWAEVGATPALKLLTEDRPDIEQSIAVAVNTQRQVAVTHLNAEHRAEAAHWNSTNGNLFPAEGGAGIESYAVDIVNTNNALLVGYRDQASGADRVGVFRVATGLVDIGRCMLTGEGADVAAADLNDSGAIVGTCDDQEMIPQAFVAMQPLSGPNARDGTTRSTQDRLHDRTQSHVAPQTQGTGSKPTRIKRSTPPPSYETHPTALLDPYGEIEDDGGLITLDCNNIFAKSQNCK